MISHIVLQSCMHAHVYCIEMRTRYLVSPSSHRTAHRMLLKFSLVHAMFKYHSRDLTLCIASIAEFNSLTCCSVRNTIHTNGVRRKLAKDHTSHSFCTIHMTHYPFKIGFIAHFKCFKYVYRTKIRISDIILHVNDFV